MNLESNKRGSRKFYTPSVESKKTTVSRDYHWDSSHCQQTGRKTNGDTESTMT